MGGSSSSESNSFEDGFNEGFNYDFDRQIENSKSPGNNPGWDNSAMGIFTNGIIGDGGAPDPAGYNAMGDYNGYGS